MNTLVKHYFAYMDRWECPSNIHQIIPASTSIYGESKINVKCENSNQLEHPTTKFKQITSKWPKIK